jgi:hypothetical protein
LPLLSVDRGNFGTPRKLNFPRHQKENSRMRITDDWPEKFDHPDIGAWDLPVKNGPILSSSVAN